MLLLTERPHPGGHIVRTEDYLSYRNIVGDLVEMLEQVRVLATQAHGIPAPTAVHNALGRVMVSIEIAEDAARETTNLLDDVDS